VAGQEDAPATDAVGDAPDGDGEAEVGEGRAQEEQREPLDVEVRLALDDEVDERVADGQQPQPRAHQGDHAKARDPEQAESGAQGDVLLRRRGLGGDGSRLRRFSTKRMRIPSPISAIEKETRKTVLYWPGQLGEQDEGGERAEHRADRVERAVHAERAAQAGALAVERDERVARGGADALAEAVDEQNGRRPQPRSSRPRRGRACTAPTPRSRWRRPPCGAPLRSATRPPSRRTSAVAPWYMPSMKPNCSGLSRTW
jgi:hypothetical protein